MICKKVLNQHEDLLDKSISPSEQAKHELHLANCLACRATVAANSALSEEIRQAIAWKTSGLHYQWQANPKKSRGAVFSSSLFFRVSWRYALVLTLTLCVFGVWVLLKPQAGQWDKTLPQFQAEVFHQQLIMDDALEPSAANGLTRVFIKPEQGPARPLRADEH